MRPFFADVFSGDGRGGRAAQRLGFYARFWDVRNGACQDLLDARVLGKLLWLIRHGHVLGMMLAPPCTSLSIANNSSGPIRSQESPRGLPNLPGYKARRVELGNRLLDATIAFIDELVAAGIPLILEQPQSSYMWCDAALQQSLARGSTFFVNAHQCVFRVRHRKATKLAIDGSELDYGRLGSEKMCQCNGKHGICSRTGRPHFWLQGVGSTRAQTFPSALSFALARCIL